LKFIDRLIDTLENGDAESSRLSGSRLSLSDDVTASTAWNNSATLNCGRLFETIGENSVNQIFLQVHLVKGFGNLIPIRFNDAIFGKLNGFGWPKKVD
jgi:hypothetical protein